MRFTRKVFVVILAAGALGSAHAVDRDRGASLPAWSIAAPDFAHDSGVPAEYSGYRLAANGTPQYRDADGGVGLKRAPGPGAAAPAGEKTATATLAPAQKPSERNTDWMLLLSGVVVAGYMARRRTRDVAG